VIDYFCRIFCYKIILKEWGLVAAKAAKEPLSLAQGFATMLTL